MGTGAWSNNGISRLVLQSPTGQLIVIDSTTANPQITFYSPDRSDIAFINAPNFGQPTRVGLGMNSGQFVPADLVARRGRVFLRDDTGVSAYEIVRASDGVREGGYVSIQFDQMKAGLSNTTTGVDQSLTINSGGIDATADGVTLRSDPALVGTQFRLVDYDQVILNTGEIFGFGSRLIAGGSPTTPASTAAAGTPTAVLGTEVKDAVIGDYVFTSQGAGHRYLIIQAGTKLSGAANSLCGINIRDGGAASPTPASPLVANATTFITVAGGGGQITLQVMATGSFTAGTHTLGSFTVPITGGAAITPVNQRELFVIDIGQV